MPASKEDKRTVPLLERGSLTALRRSLRALVLEYIRQLASGELYPSFDDAVTVAMLVNIGISDDEMHSSTPHWLSVWKYIVRELNLNVENASLDEESKEERKRLWWFTFIVDRHSSLTYNSRFSISDSESCLMSRPVADTIWESETPLVEFSNPPNVSSSPNLPSTPDDFDVFGLLIPLASILGDILDFHQLRQTQTFGREEGILHVFRTKIETRLDEYLQSLKSSATSILPDTSSNGRLLALYGEHVCHCLYILLYGKMDFVTMYQDTEWQSAPDFLKAGEHAAQCAELLDLILRLDPELQLCPRYFGTYILQSSFVFLVLAKKLGPKADDYVIRNCNAHLAALAVFVRNIGIGYQENYARILRKTLEGIYRDWQRSLGLEMPGEGGGRWEESLDPELLQYRWIIGSRGLWTARDRQKTGGVV